MNFERRLTEEEMLKALDKGTLKANEAISHLPKEPIDLFETAVVSADRIFERFTIDGYKTTNDRYNAEEKNITDFRPLILAAFSAVARIKTYEDELAKYHPQNLPRGKAIKKMSQLVKAVTVFYTEGDRDDVDTEVKTILDNYFSDNSITNYRAA